MSTTDKSPQDIYDGLTSRWKSLADKTAFEDETRRIDWVDTQVGELADSLKTIRDRGYVFAKQMEIDLAMLKSDWPVAKRKAVQLKARHMISMKRAVKGMERDVSRADKRPNLFDDLDRGLDAFERELNSAESAIVAPLTATTRKINAIKSTIGVASDLFDLLEDRSFELYPDEHAIDVREVESVGRSEIEGQLFLTDKRLIFEAREERATKKRLFVTVESETVSEVVWEAPIGALKEVSAEDKGGFLGFKVKNLLMIEFADGAGDLPNPATLRFVKASDNEEWADSLIPSVISGSINEQRIAGSSAEDEWDPTDLPTSCPNCMATLPQIFKGMHQVKCDFCGTLVNIK